MKLLISVCFFSLIILNAQLGLSQKGSGISSRKYLSVVVKKGETAFGICQQYKISQAELKEANPDLTAVLKSGAMIKIPLKEEATQTMIAAAAPTAPVTVPEPEFYYHKVVKNQTIFSIAKRYDITDKELIAYNPQIANGLMDGQILKVPANKVKTTDPTIQPKKNDEGSKVAFKDAVSEGRLSKPELPAVAIRSTEPKQAAVSSEKYKVEKGETLFSLAARFGVEVGEIKKANPSLYERSLETGETILIPQHSNSTQASKTVEKPSVAKASEISEMVKSGDCQPISGKNNHKYKVGLLLPLYLQGNQNINPSEVNADLLLKKIEFNSHLENLPTDSVAVSPGIMIDSKAEGFLEFYEGALLAIDSLQQQGMNIELCVFDASNDQMINALLQLDVFRELDLIVGPVYPELQQNVASFAAKNRIPMVSPLASNGNYEENNAYFFKVNPSKEFQIEQTAQYIAHEFKDKNFFLVSLPGNSNSTEAKLAELSKEKLLAARQTGKSAKNLFHDYNFQQQGLNSIKPLLDETGDNIFMIPSDNEAQVSVAVTNLNALAENYNIVLIGTSNLPKFKSIQTENYHHTRLRFLSPTFVDYKKPLVRRFISRYRDIFSGEPTQFSHQGFDVSFYFLSALFRFGKDFRNCLPEYKMELTQMNFNFQKVSPMGGMMNKSLFVTAYERNFDIVSYETLVSGSK